MAIDDDRAIWGLNRKAPEFKYPELENSKTGIYSYINQQWVSCQPNGSLEINRNWWQQWEYMEIRRTPDGFYTIRSTNFNRYLGIENNKASFNFLLLIEIRSKFWNVSADEYKANFTISGILLHSNVIYESYWLILAFVCGKSGSMKLLPLSFAVILFISRDLYLSLFQSSYSGISLF